VTDPKNRTKSFGMIGIAFGLGFLVGPGISGVLAQYGTTFPIFAAAGLSFTSIMCTYFLLPSAVPHPHPELEQGLSRWAALTESFKDKQLGPMLWQFLAFTFAFSTFFSGFALFAERRFKYHGVPFGTKEVAYLFAFSGLIGVLIQGGGLGRLVKVFGENRLIQIGFAMMATGFALLAGVQAIPFLLVAVGLLTLGSTILRPSLTTLITMRAARHRQGMVIGIMQVLMSIAQIVAPVIAGFLIQTQLLSTWAFAGSIFSLIGFALIAVLQ
jgi:MFS family permease